MSASIPEVYCPRCHQPVRPGGKQCPHCKERLPGSPQRLLLLVGGIGLVFLVAVVALGLFLKPFGDEKTGNPDEPQQSAPAPPQKAPLDR